MTTYYIMYGEPPRRPRWVYFVLGLATATAVMAVGAAVLALDLGPTRMAAEEPGPAAPASPEEWYTAIAMATSETAITYYLVDTSESMTRELRNLKPGLSEIIASKSPDSQVGIIVFGDKDKCEPVLPLLPLDPELAELAIDTIDIGMVGIKTDVSCAFEQALADLQPHLDEDRVAEVVLFSDGSLASVIDAECSGDVVRSANTLEGSPLFRCSGEWSYQRLPIIDDFITAGIRINGIYFQPHQYNWADQVRLLTEPTDGKFVSVRPQAAGRTMR